MTHVPVQRGDARESYSADLVVACGALNSALLLLRSASDRHPNGLATDALAELYVALGFGREGEGDQNEYPADITSARVPKLMCVVRITPAVSAVSRVATYGTEYETYTLNRSSTR